MVNFFRRKKNRRITPDGEPLEDVGGGGRGGLGFSSPLKIVIPAIIAVIIIFVILSSSVKIVDGGFRGVLTKIWCYRYLCFFERRHSFCSSI